MKLYKVVYDWMNKAGEGKTDCLTNNDEGMCLKDAEYTAYQLRTTSVCQTANVRVELMIGGKE